MQMTPNLAQPTISPFAPVYRSELTRTIGVLQQLQTLVAEPGAASLADVVQVVRDMQYDFGEDAQLESVIQALVGQHLAPLSLFLSAHYAAKSTNSLPSSSSSSAENATWRVPMPGCASITFLSRR